MISQITEKAFEDAIIESLTTNGGYQLGNTANFDRELALDRLTLLQFIQISQPQAWNKLSEIHGDTVEQKLIDRLCQELNLRGMLDVLRYGMTDYGGASNSPTSNLPADSTPKL